MDFFVKGLAYPKNKAGGAVLEAEKWSDEVVRATTGLPKMRVPCRVMIRYNLSFERFGIGNPYGPDLDNLTKRLLDALKNTILSEAESGDGCVFELNVTKTVARSQEEIGVGVSIEPLRDEAPENTFLYFSYGSNMHTARLRSRVGSAAKICNAALPGFRFRLNKRSKDLSYKANIERVAGESVVFGILWAVAVSDGPSLDSAEGISHYKKETVIVFDEEGRPWKAKTYVAFADWAVPEDKFAYDWYRQYILEGAEEHGLPPGYRQKLGDIAYIEDPDKDRRAKEHELLTGNSS